MKKSQAKRPAKSVHPERLLGRPKEFATQITLRLSASHLDGIAAVLADGEDRAEFIRSAIEREIARRAKRS